MLNSKSWKFERWVYSYICFLIASVYQLANFVYKEARKRGYMQESRSILLIKVEPEKVIKKGRSSLFWVFSGLPYCNSYLFFFAFTSEHLHSRECVILV